jgi:uncharacterized protein YbjT (DUF2867 family)
MSSTTTERVFIIGGTGNTGTVAVRDLLAKKVPVTLYARNPDKVASLFSTTDEAALKVVQGDLQDLTPLKKALAGHTRLLLVVNDFDNMVQIKTDVAEAAYGAGIKQIVDISSLTVTDAWRSSYIGTIHQESEQVLLAAAKAHGTHVVTLRPTRFLSNILRHDRPGPTSFVDNADPDAPQGWISPNDIGAVAAVILSDDIKKHRSAAYAMVGDVITAKQRAEIFTRVLGRPIAYHQLTVLERYNALAAHLSFFPFTGLYDLASMRDHSPLVSRGLVILLGRNPETFEEYVQANKQALTL